MHYKIISMISNSMNDQCKLEQLELVEVKLMADADKGMECHGGGGILVLLLIMGGGGGGGTGTERGERERRII